MTKSTSTEAIELTNEEKIAAYITNHSLNEVDLTPVIKSLYPMVTSALPAQYLIQGESRKIKHLIGEMKLAGLIQLKDDNYLRLGDGYYKNDDNKVHHHNIETLKIVAIK